MRKGKYAYYKGKEFRFSEIKDGNVKLISNNKENVDIGFEPSQKNNGVYVKIVSYKDIDRVFRINPKAKYKQELFPASNGGDGKVLLDTTNTELAQRYGFDRTDKYLYSKYVSEDEVEIVEEREPYTLD